MLQLQQTKPALVNHFPKPVGVCSSLYGPTAGSVSTADAGHPPNFLFEIFVLIFSKFVLAFLSCIFLMFF